MHTTDTLPDIFDTPIIKKAANLFVISSISKKRNQQQTNDAFSEKWRHLKDLRDLEKFQKSWYLKLYGFGEEKKLIEFLATKKIILDAGCGPGYKTAWLAELAPHATVIGMDSSESVYEAAKKYTSRKNVFFIQGDISKTFSRFQIYDYISCDQVLHHTEDPDATFGHLSDILKPGGILACYVYAKKAIPRELLDDYFRDKVHALSHQELWTFSAQMMELGKRLSVLKAQLDSPDIPLLKIKGGSYDVQRFLYWNFIKCFYNPEWSDDLNTLTNFDWYSPSNAHRYTQEEFIIMAEKNNLKPIFVRSEEACHTGLFQK